MNTYTCVCTMTQKCVQICLQTFRALHTYSTLPIVTGIATFLVWVRIEHVVVGAFSEGQFSSLISVSMSREYARLGCAVWRGLHVRRSLAIRIRGLHGSCIWHVHERICFSNVCECDMWLGVRTHANENSYTATHSHARYLLACIYELVFDESNSFFVSSLMFHGLSYWQPTVQ